jgi:hypothetical protein
MQARQVLLMMVTVRPISGKVAAVVTASPGALGRMRAQIALQISLNKLGVLVVPNSFALGLAHQAFDEQRLLKDTNADKRVRGVGAALVRTASSLAPKPHHSAYGPYPEEAAHLGGFSRKRTFLSFLGTETGDELTQRSAWAAAPMIGACPDG